MIALLALLAVVASGIVGVSPAKADNHCVGMMMDDCPGGGHESDGAPRCGMPCCFIAPLALLTPAWTVLRSSHVIAVLTIRDDFLAGAAQAPPDLRPPIA